MNKKIRKLIDRFDAISENGKRVTIFVYQYFIIVEAFGEEPQELPSVKSLSSPGTRAVNKIDEERYEILTDTMKFTVTRLQ